MLCSSGCGFRTMKSGRFSAYGRWFSAYGRRLAAYGRWLAAYGRRFSSLPSSCLGAHLSAKLCFVGGPAAPRVAALRPSEQIASVSAGRGARSELTMKAFLPILAMFVLTSFASAKEGWLDDLEKAKAQA